MRAMNIFESLRRSHQTQRSLADRLVETEARSRERLTLFKQLKTELAAHAAAEERCFYVPLIGDDRTQAASRHGIAEHHHMDELVEALEEMESLSPQWIAKAHELRHKVYHHLGDEEQGIFQQAAQVLTDAEIQSLARAYDEEMSAQRQKI